VRQWSARHDQQPAGLLVEPVNQPGARHPCQRRIVRQQRVLQRVFAITGARMHHQSGRLVEHQQFRILVHDVERQRLGADAQVSAELRLHHQPLAAADAVAAAHRLARKRHRTVANPALQPRARVLRQRCRQRLVEPQAGRLWRQLQHMRLGRLGLGDFSVELRCHRGGQLYWVD
jgi:hypothetical protein